MLLFSHDLMSNSFQHRELQHARLPILHYFPDFAPACVQWVSDASGEGYGKPLQYSCLKTPMNSMKNQVYLIKKINFAQAKILEALWYILTL